MKKIFGLTVLILFFFIAPSASAQPEGRGEGMKKIEQLEKIKLLEVLNLDEETGLKFLIRRKDFRAKQRAIQDRLDSLLDEMQVVLKSGKELSVLPKMNDEYIRIATSLQKHRNDFFHSLSDILTPEQQTKMIVFERRFREELQEMMLKNRGGRFRRGNPNLD